MEHEGQDNKPSGLGFSHADINTLVIVDEPEENTIIYAWKGKGFKKLPYDEHIAKTGQKIRTFMTFNKSERVTLLTIDKEQLSITLTVGIIENKQLKQVGEPIKYYGSKSIEKLSLRYTHKAPIDNPVIFFSLDPEKFGEEIKGRIVEETDDYGKMQRLVVREMYDHGAVGIAQDGVEKPNFCAQKIKLVE